MEKSGRFCPQRKCDHLSRYLSVHYWKECCSASSVLNIISYLPQITLCSDRSLGAEAEKLYFRLRLLLIFYRLNLIFKNLAIILFYFTYHRVVMSPSGGTSLESFVSQIFISFITFYSPFLIGRDVIFWLVSWKKELNMLISAPLSLLSQ